jgi:hypothetical protein
VQQLAGMRKLDFVSRAIHTILASLLVIGAGSNTAFADTVGKTVNWTANRPTVVQGVAADVILSAPPAVCGTNAGQLNDIFLDNTAVKPAISAQAGLSVTVGAIKHTGTCELTVGITPGGNAVTGPVRLTLTAANALAAGASQDIGYATITVVSSQSSAIPDGLAPQVDIDYIVLPYQTAYDNYGRRVADQYYVVIPKIGNNTGFSLQLAGIGFAGTPTGNTDPAIVQGTLIYGQDYSARNVLYRSLIWAALIGAGVSPYFHSANAKANFAIGLALFSGPFIAGFSQQFPDNTVKQLARLGASDVMSNQNVIPNNTQLSFVAFVGRDTLCPPGDTKEATLCGSSKHWMSTFYDPTAVKTRLGAITIVGNLLPVFSARIKVTSPTSGTPPTAGVANAPAIEGKPSLISLQSTGLTAASPSLPLPAGITSTNVITDSSFQISALLLSKPTSPLTVSLIRKDGSTVAFPISVIQPVAVVTPPAGATTVSAVGSTGVTITWQNGGPDLTNVIPTMVATDGVFTKTGSTPTTISGSIAPAKAGTLTVTLPITVNGSPITDIPAPTIVAK